jgi:hypothetical protein
MAILSDFDSFARESNNIITDRSQAAVSTIGEYFGQDYIKSNPNEVADALGI